MKTVLVLATVLAAVLAIPAEYYDSKFDSFNAKEAVENIRLLENMTKCIAGKGPCSPDAEKFKKITPEAIRTTCGKCSPKQRELVRIVVQGMQSKLPELWNEIVQKYDPTGEYKESFDKFIYGSD